MLLLIIKIYLAINILFALTYILLKGMRLLGEVFQIPISYLNLNKIAQILFLVSLAAPIGLYFIPDKAVPAFNVEFQKPVADALDEYKLPDGFNQDKTVANRQAPFLPDLASESKINYSRLFVAVLLISSFFALTKLSYQLLQLRKLIQNSFLIRKIGKVSIFVSEDIAIPFSTLIGGVNILLPLNSANLNSSRLIIQHELHHHRNGDTLWILFMEAACCFFFLNPIVHLWKKEISEIQEFACDETLISQMRVSAYEYGQCLIKIAEVASKTSSMQIGTICMGASPKGPHQIKSFLRRRIEMFNEHQVSGKKRFLGITLGTLGVLLATGISYGSQQLMRSKPKQTINSGVAHFDPKVQQTTEEVLNKYVKKFGAKGGFILVADPRNGKILSVANTFLSDKNLKKHWALSFQIQPASAMKPLIAAMAINKGIIKSNDKLNCEDGKYGFGGRTFYDWKPLGTLTTTEFVSQSSNICGIKLGEKLGVQVLESTLKDFGFGPAGSASDFPEAMTGVYPLANEMSANEYVPLLTTGNTSGDVFLVTPLEIVQAYGAIANGGKLLKPVDADASQIGQVLKQVVAEKTANEMKEILVAAVQKGTGTHAQSLKYSTAGKTSSLIKNNPKNLEGLQGVRAMAGFVGFAPVQSPSLLVYVGILDPTDSKDKNPHGNEHAAPVFREVIETLLPQMNVAPDKTASL